MCPVSTTICRSKHPSSSPPPSCHGTSISFLQFRWPRRIQTNLTVRRVEHENQHIVKATNPMLYMAIWRKGLLKPRASGDDRESHLSFEESLDLFPVQRVDVEIHQFLGYLGLDVPTKLLPELLHGQLFRQAGFQLRDKSVCVREWKRKARVCLCQAPRLLD